MNVTTFTEVRTVTGIRFQADRHLFFDGIGRVRRERNDGQPQVLIATRNTEISGRLHGEVKMVCIAQTFGKWFSLREVGGKGSKRTVYLRGDSLLVVDGSEVKVSDFYNENQG